MASRSFIGNRSIDREKLKEKAMRLKLKETMTSNVCIRIQSTCKKSPEISRKIAGWMVANMLKAGLDGNLPDTEFRAMVAEGAKQFASVKMDATSAKNSGRKPTPKTHRSRRKSSSSELRTMAERGNYKTEAQLQQESVAFQGAQRLSPTKANKKDIWSDLVQHSTAEAQATEQIKVEKQVKTREKWVDDLENQRRIKERKLKAEREANEKYHKETMERLEAENKIEQEKQSRRIQLAKEQHLVQNQQRREKEEIKMKEDKLKAYEEHQLVLRIKKQQQSQEAAEAAKKQAEKTKMMRVLDENDEYLQRKEQAKQKEREYEIKLQEEYISMEEAKDAARKKALEDMSAKIQAKMKYFDDTSKAEMDKKEKEEAMLCLKYQLEHEQKKKQDEDTRNAKKRERNRLQQLELKRQMEFKKQSELNEKREHSKQAEIWNYEAQQAKLKEQYQTQERLSRNKLQQMDLKRQMQERERKLQQADHTAVEIQLNKSILSKTTSKVVQETHIRSNQIATQEKLNRQKK